MFIVEQNHITIPAKTIVTKTKSDSWFGAEYNMNIYRGCCHGCIYCDSRSSCYQNFDFDIVKEKENALEIIQRELKGKTKKGVIGTGSMSDPYNPAERKRELMREALKIVDMNGFGIAVATKGTLITRDIDIFKSIMRHSPVITKITITAADDGLSEKVEPNAPVSNERFTAIKELSYAGIYCGILLMPVLPFIEDNENNIREIVEKAHLCGAKFIYAAFGVSMRDGQREYMYKRFDETFPGMSDKYKQTYGSMYSCKSENASQLWSVFKNECNRYGILYDMPEIIKAYKGKYESTQMSLF